MTRGRRMSVQYMPNNGTMDSIRISKSELLSKLEANRTKHIELVGKLEVIHRDRATRELTDRLELVKSGGKFDLHFSIPTPQNMSREYDRAIAKLRLSADEFITLSNNEFSQYVLDDWSWKGGFSSTANFYNMAAE